MNIVYVYGVLLPRERTSTQEFWNEHIAILRNATDGGPYHLGTLSALLLERLYFFKEQSSRNNGLLLVQMSATAWQILRTLADIDGDERAWFQTKVSNPESRVWDESGVRPFFNQMHEVYEIASFLRHPVSGLMAYDWVFHSTWPRDKADFIVQAADSLHSIMHMAVNEFALAAGWEGDTTTKTLHDTAMRQWLPLQPSPVG